MQCACFFFCSSGSSLERGGPNQHHSADDPFLVGATPLCANKKQYRTNEKSCPGSGCASYDTSSSHDLQVETEFRGRCSTHKVASGVCCFTCSIFSCTSRVYTTTASSMYSTTTTAVVSVSSKHQAYMHPRWLSSCWKIDVDCASCDNNNSSERQQQH